MTSWIQDDTFRRKKLNPFTRIFIENPKKIPCVKPQLWNFYYGNMVNSFSISLFLIGERDREREIERDCFIKMTYWIRDATFQKYDEPPLLIIS